MLNVQLLKKVRDYILEEPKRLIMASWFRKKTKESTTFIGDDYRQQIPFAQCGTAACIGGWACILSGKDPSKFDPWNTAGELLGLESYSERDRLFLASNWPKPYHKQYAKAKTQEQRAKIAANRINHFIKTKGAE